MVEGGLPVGEHAEGPGHPLLEGAGVAECGELGRLLAQQRMEPVHPGAAPEDVQAGLVDRDHHSPFRHETSQAPATDNRLTSFGVQRARGHTEGLGPMRYLKALVTLVVVTAVVAAGAGIVAYAASRVLVSLMS